MSILGQPNPWVQKGYKNFLFSKIKEHQAKHIVHQEAQEAELKIASQVQPNWVTTRAKEVSKQRQAVQNLMFASIYICHQYHSLNSLEPMCVLFEKLGVQILPSTVSVVNYRNDDACLSFLQHIGGYLHEELIEKVKASPVVGTSVSLFSTFFDSIFAFLGWMMDESTSRTVEKSCIVYVRYLEDYKPMTSFYGILNLEGDGTAANIVKTVRDVWQKDDLNPGNSCWFASDNASTFTGSIESFELLINFPFANCRNSRGRGGQITTTLWNRLSGIKPMCSTFILLSRRPRFAPT